MTLTEEQIDYISRNLEFYGIASEELKEDLLDHICTYIEQGSFADFETAYKEAMQKFGGHHAMGSIQRETYLQVTLRKTLLRKKVLYIAGYITASLFCCGLFFKLFHWPGAGVLLGLAFLSLILFFLPVYFYQYFKSSERKLYEN